MDDDYFYIEERIREARRLRSEAAGEFFAAAWHYLNRIAGNMAHGIVDQLRANHLLPH